MDFRKVTVILTLLAGGLCALAQGLSLGALDMISGSKGNGAGSLDIVSAAKNTGSGALDAIMDSFAEDDTRSGTGALSVVAAAASSGRVSTGALRFVSNSSSHGGYYKSGAWDIPSVAGYNEMSGNGALWMGQMLPVPQWGRITSTFGFRPRFGRMHKGIDIAMSVGDTVCCPISGVVDRISFEAGGYGHYVVVKHENGLETRYAHLSATLVSPGDYVTPTSPIALSGNTGNSTGPHLHFETRINGTAIDPQSIFNFAGGKMIPKYGQGSLTYSSSPAGALNHVSQSGVRGRDLNERRTYVVKTGDTLEKIAGLAGTSVLELCKLNFIMESDPLVPGTMIRLRK